MNIELDSIGLCNYVVYAATVSSGIKESVTWFTVADDIVHGQAVVSATQPTVDSLNIDGFRRLGDTSRLVGDL